MPHTVPIEAKGLSDVLYIVMIYPTLCMELGYSVRAANALCYLSFFLALGLYMISSHPVYVDQFKQDTICIYIKVSHGFHLCQQFYVLVKFYLVSKMIIYFSNTVILDSTFFYRNETNYENNMNIMKCKYYYQ